MMAPWILFSAGCGVVLLHLAVYFFLLRDWAALQKEKGIFLYHFISFVAVTFAAAASCFMFPADQMLKAVLAVLAFHAIYSMSFLELWSLSQISYSIAILDAIEKQPGLELKTVTARFSGTGQEKRESRLAGLQNIGLIVVTQERVELTPRGRAAASVLSALRWIANLKNTG